MRGGLGHVLCCGVWACGLICGCGDTRVGPNLAPVGSEKPRWIDGFASAEESSSAQADRSMNRAAAWFLAADSSRESAGLAGGAGHADAHAGDPSISADESFSRRGPLPGLWETIERDLRMAPRDLWEDTKSVYGKGPNLVILGLTYGGSLALQQSGVDDSIASSLDRPNTIFSKGFGEAFAALGNPGTHFGVASLWYLVGQQRQDERTYDVGRTMISALTVNGLTVLLGQTATSDRSPNGERGTFPSGHTSSTFTIASVMHQAYGPWVGAPLYALGGLVATERLDNGEHYFSDVVMGAVMGLVIGHTIAGEHEIEVFGGRIVPYADPESGASGIAWHVSF